MVILEGQWSGLDLKSAFNGEPGSENLAMSLPSLSWLFLLPPSPPPPPLFGTGAHCIAQVVFGLLGISHPPASVPQVPGTTGVRRISRLFSFFAISSAELWGCTLFCACLTPEAGSHQGPQSRETQCLLQTIPLVPLLGPPRPRAGVPERRGRGAETGGGNLCRAVHTELGPGGPVHRQGGRRA